jgi:hypothetical protein
MSELDAAWFAGFFDGEGALCQCTSRLIGKKCWRISVSNTHLGALQRCQSITGAGKISEKRYITPKPDHHKQQWFWQVHAQRDIAIIVRQIAPYLTVKKEKVEQFLSAWVDV